jgi:hypothetical protein
MLHVVLTGFMASGVDTDQIIEENAGRSISEILHPKESQRSSSSSAGRSSSSI